MNQATRFHAQIFALIAATLSGSAFGADIKVTLEGLASDQGQVLVGLYDKASEFPRGKRMADLAAPARKGALTLVFKDVPAGSYAISAFHDINKNNRLDANMSGLPTEPVGASRDAIGKMGPPSFADAAFSVGGAAVDLTIHLK